MAPTVPLRVLRKVEDMDNKVALALRTQLSDRAKLAQKNNPDEFAQLLGLLELDGYVDNDVPRDFELTQEIMDHTVAYAVADMSGRIIRDEIATLAEAEMIRTKAKIQVVYDVQVDDE